MKKYWLAITAVIALLFALVITPAIAKDQPRSITFTEAHNYNGKGLVLKFSYTGSFKNYEFKDAVAFWNGHSYTLDCNISSSSVITCVTQYGLRKQVGKLISGNIAGFRFFATIPAPKDIYRAEIYCYSIWDTWYFINNGEWTDMSAYIGGPRCQEKPAQEGDVFAYEFVYNGMTYYNPELIFLNNGGGNCGAPNYGPAYYYSAESPDDCNSGE